MNVFAFDMNYQDKCTLKRNALFKIKTKCFLASKFKGPELFLEIFSFSRIDWTMRTLHTSWQ